MRGTWIFIRFITDWDCGWGWSFLFMRYAEGGAIASTWPTWYHWALWRRVIVPPPPIDNDHWSHQHLLFRMKHQEEYIHGPGPYHHGDTAFLFFAWWWSSKTLKCDTKAYIQHPYPYIDIAPIPPQATHSHALKKANKEESKKLSPNSTFLNGMGLRLSNGISPYLFFFLRGGVWQAILKSFLYFR